MTDKTPWQEDGSPWKTEAAFLAWVRGVLRKGWSKHPLKIEFIKRNRKRIVNPKNNPRFPEVWGMTCEVCLKDKVQTEIEIDHISETGGTFKKLEDAFSYMSHLFMVNYAKMRAVCKPCHEVINHSQKMGVSFEEAALQKKVIAFGKKSTKEVVSYCKNYGYTDSMLSNAAKRKSALTDILRRHLEPNSQG